MRYEQYCPIAKAAEVLGERWTLLVLRELLAGATRYAELQRGLGRISPSVLSSRLKTLIAHGIIERVAGDSAHGSEYRVTSAGKELAPVLEAIAVWGQHWVRSSMTRDELDVELVMLQVQRNFDDSAFPKNHAVVGFVFSDLHGSQRRWWLLLDDGKTELCVRPPGRSEDVTLTCGVRTLAQLFTGETTVQVARGTRRLEVRGPNRLIRNVHHWLCASPLADRLRASSG
ncbi:MAG TPA: winged helix-turn-helix transcriptional regulator [Polyangiaceae bacterium]|nr:winged helix-turn-helix transcriptional regulator [Polyangiaceae bacterium]